MSLPHDAEGENEVVFKNAYISTSRAVEALVHLTKGSLAAERSQGSADQIALCKSVQRPIALKCIQEPAPKPTWRSKPSWFLIAEDDRMINPKTQHFMAKRMQARIHSFAVDHTPLLTAPEKVLEVIIAAAQETLS